MRFYYDRDRERGRGRVAQNVGRRPSLEVVRAVPSSGRRLAFVLSQDCREAGRRRGPRPWLHLSATRDRERQRQSDRRGTVWQPPRLWVGGDCSCESLVQGVRGAGQRGLRTAVWRQVQ
jgi:hypothetical protein